MGDNKIKCREFYERRKADPARHAEWLKKQAMRMRERRAALKGKGDNRGDNRVITGVITEDVITPEVITPSHKKGGKYLAPQAQGEVSLTPEAIIEQWHRHFGSQEHD